MAAKKKTETVTKKAAPKAATKSAVVSTTPVRNSPVPKVAKAAAPKPAGVVAKKEVTSDQIAVRAYEIWASGQGGSEHDNWLRAERELRGL
ncbi:MAG TPA: DUF2934 domain-containing protein [Tepidisphaeraceae bacterium]|nr:DUF2934 domain-containing protein [Tepidisphaeraceae bacterium]